jgi:intracellular septation protein
MKFFTDFFPVILFFLVFKAFDVFTATAVAIAATVAQIAWIKWRVGKVEMMQWASLIIIVVFGGATLIFHDETFIKIKPSILYAFMGCALYASEFVFKKNLLEKLMSEQISAPPKVWRTLLHAWACFFFGLSVLNYWVATNFDTETWVNFKLFGAMGLMVVFAIIQAVYLSTHVKGEEAQLEETGVEASQAASTTPKAPPSKPAE